MSADCFAVNGGLCSFERIDSSFMADGVWWQVYECTECGRVEDRRMPDEDDPEEFF